MQRHAHGFSPNPDTAATTSSTSTYLEKTAQLLIDRYSGDLRELCERADGDVDVARDLLGEFTGTGRLGVSIFLREVQVVWTEFALFVDERVLDEAEALAPPTTAKELRDLVDTKAVLTLQGRGFYPEPRRS